VTFGLLPVLRWGKRFGQFVTLEQQQFWHLAEWLRLHTKSPAAAELPGEADRIHYRPMLTLLSVLCVVAVVVMIYRQLRMTTLSWHSLTYATYLYAGHHRPWYRDGFLVWGAGLSVAYALHWAQVRLHAADRARFIRSFNHCCVTESIEPITPTPLGLGIRPLWIVAGIGITALGAPWGVPMMLAGAIQRSEITEASLRDRQALARRLYTMLQRRRSDVAVPVALRRLCSHEFCRAKLPDAARFCPRCGARATVPMHRVA
jgi:hypothetical protein